MLFKRTYIAVVDVRFLRGCYRRKFPILFRLRVYPLALQGSQDSIVAFLPAKPPAHQASTKGDCFADNRPITVSGPQSYLFRTVTKESIFTILVSLEISCHALQGINHFTLGVAVGDFKKKISCKRICVPSSQKK